MNTALQVAAARAGGLVLPDTGQWTNRIQIRSESSDKLYTVAQRRTDGSFACSCFGFIRHRHCKHVDTIAPLLIGTTRKGHIR